MIRRPLPHENCFPLCISAYDVSSRDFSPFCIEPMHRQRISYVAFVNQFEQRDTPRFDDRFKKGARP
jgi:hypothetical protein